MLTLAGHCPHVLRPQTHGYVLFKLGLGSQKVWPYLRTSQVLDLYIRACLYFPVKSNVHYLCSDEFTYIDVYPLCHPYIHPAEQSCRPEHLAPAPTQTVRLCGVLISLLAGSPLCCGSDVPASPCWMPQSIQS